jgi:hypothetical protein
MAWGTGKRQGFEHSCPRLCRCRPTSIRRWFCPYGFAPACKGRAIRIWPRVSTSSHGVRRRHHGRAHRQGGDLRADPLHPQMERRGRDAGAGQRGRILAHLLDLDQRSRHRVSRRGGGGGGLRLDHDVSKRFLGAPFGGYKQSGVGREEGIEELISCTREKNIHVNLKRRTGGHEAVCHVWTSRRLSPRPSLLSRSLVRGHRSEIMFSVLEVILRPDHIAGQGFSLGQREIPLIASLRILRTFRLGASRTRCPPP